MIFKTVGNNNIKLPKSELLATLRIPSKRKENQIVHSSNPEGRAIL